MSVIPDRGYVLITGARSGIGRATALHLDSLGFSVIATDLPLTDSESLEREASDRLSSVDLDVTDPDSIAAAAERAREITGGRGLAGLVNNAGIAVAGPLEHVPLDDIRTQLEVNTIGPIAVSRAMLPLLRIGRGRIVNITSLAGRISAPFLGPYSASKHALEAVSASMRVELKPWGIHVCAIEPGFLRTGIYEAGNERFDRMAADFPPEVERDYGDILAGRLENQERLQRRALSPKRAAKTVARALTSKRPKARYLVGPDARVLAAIHTIAGPRAVEAVSTLAMRPPKQR